ncbi:hypothetical protein SDC9_164132 [bioreactor metagenome]|uniref:Uncharacterized protein n=1 Tax=bioreactor metagenome TaxID=1076179 RepID=A0A645FQS7_9ZZZZ
MHALRQLRSRKHKTRRVDVGAGEKTVRHRVHSVLDLADGGDDQPRAALGAL